MKKLLVPLTLVSVISLFILSCATNNTNTNIASNKSSMAGALTVKNKDGLIQTEEQGALKKDDAIHLTLPVQPSSAPPRFPAASRNSEVLSNFKDDGKTIDILVVYTAKALKHFQDSGVDITATINKAIDITNQTFQHSQIDLKVNLVHAQQVSFQESESFDADLDRISEQDDGVEIRALRDQYHADQVTVIRYQGDYEGKAYELEDLDPANFEFYSKHAYSMLKSSCVAQGDNNYYCFTHELGHNLGAGHDYDKVHLYPDSKGYCFTYNGTQYGTMMSYCGADNRILYFSTSDPNVKYPSNASDAVPIGDGNANNVRAIRASKLWVANYRTSH